MEKNSVAPKSKTASSFTMSFATSFKTANSQGFVRAGQTPQPPWCDSAGYAGRRHLRGCVGLPALPNKFTDYSSPFPRYPRRGARPRSPTHLRWVPRAAHAATPQGNNPRSASPKRILSAFPLHVRSIWGGLAALRRSSLPRSSQLSIPKVP